MSRYIDIETIKPRQYENSEVELGVLAYDYDEVDAMPFLNIVKCADCRKCIEQGGHANCNGYLYCTRQKTMVDEDCFCAWGEER